MSQKNLSREIKKDVATAMAKMASSHVKKAAAPKAKDGFWTGLLKGAASVAADLAPAIIPFLLASHAPTRSAVSASGNTAFASSSVPLATSGSIGNLAGLKGITGIRKDSHGTINHLTITTLDLIAPIGDGTQSAGEVVFEAWISPQDPVFENTKFANFGGSYERYRVRRCAFIYEPTCPATVDGALSMSVFVDPLVTLNNGASLENQRIVGSQEGADTFQLWAAGVACMPKCTGDLLYTDADGSDIRLVVQAKLVVVAAAALDGTGGGNLYMLAETEYEVPSLSEDAQSGLCAYLNDTVDTAHTTTLDYFPITTLPPALNANVQNLGGGSFVHTGTFTAGGVAATGNCFINLPQGDWYFEMDGAASTNLVDGYPSAFLTDECVTLGGAILNGWAAPGANGTKQVVATVFSIPPGMNNVPSVYLAVDMATNGNLTNCRLFCSKIDEDLFTNDDDDALPRYGSFLANRKRRALFSRTSQGMQSATQLELARLARIISKPSALQLYPSTSLGAVRHPQVSVSRPGGK